MPRGRRKKQTVEEIISHVGKEEKEIATTTEVIQEAIEEVENAVRNEEEQKEEKRERKEEINKPKTREDWLKEAGALGKGQKYFEAPDGRILVGDDTKNQLFDRVTGSYINPMRD